MTIFVSTCDKYDHLLPGFAYLFNKYWGPHEVHVLHFRKPPPLPSNFICCQLAPIETKAWTTHQRDYFMGVTDPYFTILLDDYWLTQPVNKSQIDSLEQLLNTRQAAKADLTASVRKLGYKTYAPGFITANQHARYRSSLQPAIWRRDYYLKLLVPGRNIWQFETTGMKEAFNDQEAIIALDSPNAVYNYANVYLKGAVNHGQLALLSPVDLETLKRQGHLSFTEVTNATQR